MFEVAADDVLELAIAIYFQHGFSKYDDADSGNPVLHTPATSEMIIGQLLGITKWAELNSETRRLAGEMRHRIPQLFLERKMNDPDSFSSDIDMPRKTNDYLAHAAGILADNKPFSLKMLDYGNFEVSKLYSLSIAPVIVMREDRKVHFQEAVKCLPVTIDIIIPS